MPYFLSLIGAVVWSAALLWVILHLSAKYDENHNFFKLLAIVAAPVLLPFALLWLHIEHVSPAVAMALSFLVTIPLVLWLIHKYCRLSWRRAIITSAIFFVGTAILNVAVDAVREHTQAPALEPIVVVEHAQKPLEVVQSKRKLLPEERILVEVMQWHVLRFTLAEQIAALRETQKAFPSIELCGIAATSVRQGDEECVSMHIRGRISASAAEALERFRTGLSNTPDIAAIADKVVTQSLAVEPAPASQENRLFTIDCIYKPRYLPAGAAGAVTGPLSADEVALGLKAAQVLVLRPVNGDYTPAAEDIAKAYTGGIRTQSIKGIGIVPMSPVGGHSQLDAFALRVSAQANDAELDKFIRAIEGGNPMIRISAMSVQMISGSETRNVELTIEWPVWSSQLEANRLLERAQKLSKQIQGKKVK